MSVLDGTPVSAGLSAATISRRALLVGLGASAIATRSLDLGDGNSSPLIQLPQSVKPAPSPTPVPTAVGQGYVDPQRYYRPEHGDNWRPALQAAFTAGVAQNKEVVLERATYNCWQKPQPSYYPSFDFNQFALFSVNGSLRTRSVNSTGSKVVRKGPRGAAYGVNDYTPIPGGYEGRGGCLVMWSDSTMPGEDPSLRSFASHGILFDGALRRADRLAFDPNVLDKGLWQRNDHNSGNIRITGTPSAPGGFIGWGGENLYSSAINGSEASRRVLYIDDNCVFGDTGGSALNPNGITCNIGACLVRDSFIGFEGQLGENGAYCNATVRDCEQSALQAGTANQDPTRGGYFKYTSPTPGVTALARLGMTLIRSPLLVGCGMRGAITNIDCALTIGGAAYLDGVSDVDLDVLSMADQANPNPGVFLVGAGAELASVKIRQRLQRTAAAEAAGRKFIYALGYYGKLGAGIEAQIVTNGICAASSPCAPFAPFSGASPSVTVL